MSLTTREIRKVKDMNVYDLYKILRVDLSRETCREERVPRDVVRTFVGGKGLAAYYLFHELDPNTDPFSPENRLIFMLGPLTYVYPGFPRYTVVTKSPLTGTFTDSYAGGAFPVELRKAGYIGIIIEGKAGDLVYLEIDNGDVSVQDASRLKGKTTADVDEALEGFRVAAIGLAGENLVRFASIMNDMGKKSGRSGAAGRGGCGAVMGSKNLKALAVRGKKNIEVPEKVREVRQYYTKILKNNKGLQNWTRVGGNLPLINQCNRASILPTRNFREGTFEAYKNINESAVGTLLVKKQGCPRCPVPCGEVIKAKEGHYKGAEVQELEYETVAMCGSNCGQGDLSVIIESAHLCDVYGIDTISTGAVIAFAMECCEKGLLDYPLRFGDPKGQVELIEKIVRREGLGDVLAEGVKRASEAVGGEQCAVHIKGLEVPAYDARNSSGMCLSYATADRGGCHLRAWVIGEETLYKRKEYTREEKANLVRETQDFTAALWCLISCNNLINGDNVSGKDVVVMLNGAGFDFTEEEFLQLGERTYNMTRLFNAREGFSRKDDVLPVRFKEPRGDTGWRITQEDFEQLLDEYYAVRGWDYDGIPTGDTLERLGLH